MVLPKKIFAALVAGMCVAGAALAFNYPLEDPPLAGDAAGAFRVGTGGTSLGIGGVTDPASTLSVGGDVSIGSAFAFADSPGLIVDGQLGIGTAILDPVTALGVAGGVAVGQMYADVAGPVDGLALEGRLGVGTTTSATAGDPAVKVAFGGITLGQILQRGTWNSRVPIANLLLQTLVPPLLAPAGGPLSFNIGPDGLPGFAYETASLQFKAIRFYKCGTVRCDVDNQDVIIQSASGGAARSPEFLIGDDGLPTIIYWHNLLKVIRCLDHKCVAKSTPVQISGTSSLVTTDGVSAAIGPNGFPVVVYVSVSNVLQVFSCSSADCSVRSTLTTISSNGSDVSLAIGADGFPLVVYRDVGAMELKLVRCQTLDCSSFATPVILDTAGDTGYDASLTIGVDGLPIVSYYDATGADLKVARCANFACTSGVTTYAVDGVGMNVGQHPATTIGPNGFLMVSYYSTTNGDLRFVSCGGLACNPTSATEAVIPMLLDSGGSSDVGSYSDIAIGSDGLPIVAYYDVTAQTIRVFHCGSDRCVPYWTRR